MALLRMYQLPKRDYVRIGWVRLAPASYVSNYRMLALILLLQLITIAFLIVEVVR